MYDYHVIAVASEEALRERLADLAKMRQNKAHVRDALMRAVEGGVEGLGFKLAAMACRRHEREVAAEEASSGDIGSFFRRRFRHGCQCRDKAKVRPIAKARYGSTQDGLSSREAVLTPSKTSHC